MSGSVTETILGEHIIDGELTPGSEIAIRIDHTLTQDATGTLAYLQFEALGIERVRNELAVSYVDHNMLQTGFENADDHRFLQTAAAKFGAQFSRPGNGICHQVHLERFAAPGKTLLGSDSHTPTAGGMGMLAIGAGGLDIAMAMAGEPFVLEMPTVVGVRLEGALAPMVSAKDIILELLRRITVRGGRGRIFEYVGPGVDRLSVPERATVTNMGAELGATTSIFPSDEQTRRYLRAQGREQAWRQLRADAGASYPEELTLDLATLGPLVALPHAPDHVVPIGAVAGTPIQQVAIGSCTNSSYRDLLIAAKILEGRTIDPSVSLVVSPGSRQAFLMAEREGVIETFVRAGARILESACGPCIGMGQAPASGSASLRSFNRNFRGRSGTPDAEVYLASPEVCAASALAGRISDPRDLPRIPHVRAIPAAYRIDDSQIIAPAPTGAGTILRGPNIAPLPTFPPLPATLGGPLLKKLGDDVSTDDILPAGAEILPLRSNIPALAHFAFRRLDPTFAGRAATQPGSFIVAGSNYGQGSSREHAAIVLRYLGVQAVIAESFARIHAANLVNFGIVPLLFADRRNLELLREGDMLAIEGVAAALNGVSAPLRLDVSRLDRPVLLRHELTARQIAILEAGGLLNRTRRATTDHGEPAPRDGAFGPALAGRSPLGATVTMTDASAAASHRATAERRR
ncbi:MAG: aconitate hydratase [Candidatus Limnocylindria bacterium]